MTGLTRAFLLLLALSVATTLLTHWLPAAGTGMAAAFLLLSGWKGRVILNAYLGLGETRVWRRGFNGIITGFLILAFGLYLLPLAL